MTANAQENLALGKPVSANSENPSFPTQNVVDGKITRESKWMSADVKPPHILEVDLQKYCNISRVVIHTGITEEERTPGESTQAAGFWSAKNFKLQYWDDANWTDLTGTEVHENRLTHIEFSFPTQINTFKLRLVCDDGEPISIMEFEIFGEETDVKAPVVDSSLKKKSLRTKDQFIDIKVANKQIGNTMKYVGYNQGYYLPGSNTSGWLEYSGVNSLRVWTTLSSYVPLSAVQVDDKVTTVDEFDERKKELRQNPEKNNYLKWDILLPIYNDPEKGGSTNPMVLNYVLSELRRLKIDPVIQASSTDFNDSWSNKWQQWQRYYALAFYAAKVGDVTMFATQNEPNHRNAGMKLEQWIGAMQVVSDAITCAIEDVNQWYDKKLTSKMVGPVTAGNNPEWWAAVAKAMRTDYHGNTIDHDLIQIFSTHSYNSPAAGYKNRVNTIRDIITENHPEGSAPPIVYTEIGRWMNAYLIDKEETMDSPSLFTEWAGIYTNNTLNNAYGMWAFKFSNTTSSSYNKGVKSGHHFTWQGERIVEDALDNLLSGKMVTTYNKSPGSMITDGIKTDDSGWKSDAADTKKWVEIDLGAEQELGSALIYSGSDGGVYTAPDRIRSFKLQYLSGNTWSDIPGATVKNNKYAQYFIRFDEPVTTRSIRFLTEESGIVTIREIKAFSVHKRVSKEPNYNVSGIQRTGEVVRLFAKGFKNELPLYKTTSEVKDENFDALTSFDAGTGNYYMWLVQRGTYNNTLTIDFSHLPVLPGSPVIAEKVGPEAFGEVTDLLKINESGKVSLTLSPQSVMLLTIPTGNLEPKIFSVTDDATVLYGSRKHYGKAAYLKVALDASTPENNHVSFIQFKPAHEAVASASRILLKVNGYNATDTSLVRLHVYGIPSTNWKESSLTWDNAPQLDSLEALITDVGRKAYIAGELAMDHVQRDHYLDVTDLMKNHPSRSVTFVFVRETRQMGDDVDKGKTVNLSSKESKNSPQLEIWVESSDAVNSKPSSKNEN